jgi:CheY-like chemotaxis protein
MARILVVDDHPHIVYLLQRELEAETHTVRSAATGEEALQEIRQEAPDLVVLDIMLPGKTGFEVLKAMKADPVSRSIPVILLTAMDHPSDISHGLQLGADWYLTKPFRPGDVASVARRFLNGPRAADSAEQDRRVELPLAEIDLFTMTAAEAFGFAVRGDVAEGLDCLLAGIRRAEAARAAGEPWGEELLRRYQEVRDHYLTRHGAAPGELLPEHRQISAGATL